MSCSWDLITLSWTFQKEVLATWEETLYIDSLEASSLLPRFLPYSFRVGRRVWFMCRRCNGCRTARTDVCGWYTSVLRNVLLSWVKFCLTDRLIFPWSPSKKIFWCHSGVSALSDVACMSCVGMCVLCILMIPGCMTRISVLGGETQPISVMNELLCCLQLFHSLLVKWDI